MFNNDDQDRDHSDQSEFNSLKRYINESNYPLENEPRTFKDIRSLNDSSKKSNSFSSIRKIILLVFVCAFIPFVISFAIKMVNIQRFNALSKLPETNIIDDIQVNFSGVSPYITAEIDRSSISRYEDFGLSLSKTENISKGEKIKLYITADNNTLVEKKINLSAREKELVPEITLEWITIDREFSAEEMTKFKQFVENHYESVDMKNPDLADQIIEIWQKDKQKVVDYDSAEVIDHKLKRIQIFQTNKEKGSGKDMFGDYHFNSDTIAVVETTVKTDRGEKYIGYVNLVFKKLKLNFDEFVYDGRIDYVNYFLSSRFSEELKFDSGKDASKFDQRGFNLY